MEPVFGNAPCVPNLVLQCLLRLRVAAMTDQQKATDLLRNLVFSVRDLIAESAGVQGLHLNGDLAYWESLTRGGRFEEWLMSYDEAAEFISEADRAKREEGK